MKVLRPNHFDTRMSDLRRFARGLLEAAAPASGVIRNQTVVTNPPSMR
jgi:hypothetical protein